MTLLILIISMDNLFDVFFWFCNLVHIPYTNMEEAGFKT